MKTINFTKFPLLNRDGGVVETDIEEIFLDTAYKNSQTRNDVAKNLSFKNGEDIELTDENVEYILRYIGFINPAICQYSFEKYIETK